MQVPCWEPTNVGATVRSFITRELCTSEIQHNSVLCTPELEQNPTLGIMLAENAIKPNIYKKYITWRISIIGHTQFHIFNDF